MSTCAALSEAENEPLAGTAATAATWLALEQPGPWGADALASSRLDPSTGRALAEAAGGTGVRVALIRRPGRAGGTSAGPWRRAVLAHTAPGRTWVRTALLADPRELLALDFARLGGGHHDGWGEPHRGAPLLLVCANGRRDRCCAVLGRPLAAQAEAAGGAWVWESSHLGGHRFAPTLLALPHGYAYGRVTPLATKAVLAGLLDGRVVLDGCRGRSTWDRPGQAAELAVRAHTGETGADALTAATRALSGGSWEVDVRHADGRSWRVSVRQEHGRAPVPASCGATPAPQPRLRVTGLAAVPAGA
ncbi:sucrase ferredoxin [Streptomyces sp. 7-21]|uniref:sucrase ferredoxin n=1 Tax=Streptomyces sp. 7-21 TaxID=2802283 RepID=UPI00191D6938|nr:sucrase ferredoxin [Streptomyces sp. 7-21]MBL1067103.1 sucrase ferredoxin [Streptomyces sp. 7-21]